MRILPIQLAFSNQNRIKINKLLLLMISLKRTYNSLIIPYKSIKMKVKRQNTRELKVEKRKNPKSKLKAL